MVVITEMSDDGDDANKKAKELEEKPKQVEKKLKEKVSYSLPIPNVLIVKCFARVSRHLYPTLSLVSSPLYLHIASPELYIERSNIGNTESVLYAYVRFPPPENPSWYILHRKPYHNLPKTLSLKLGKIDSLPSIPRGSAVVTIGSNIYVIGGCIDGGLTSMRSKIVTLIDCKSHTYQSAPRMRISRSHAAAGVIDGKIYVIGGCEKRSFDWVEVFDVKEQTWSRPSGWPIQPNWFNQILAYAVMEEKIYIMEEKSCYAYDPKEMKWITSGLNNSLLPRWDEASSCVIDDMLFCIDRIWPLSEEYPIIIYDPKKQDWRVLKGLQGFPAPSFLKDPKMTNFGGNLVILSGDQSRFTRNCEYGKKEICYVEISLERREDGDIWGKVESVAVVLTPLKPPNVELCGTVMV